VASFDASQRFARRSLSLRNRRSARKRDCALELRFGRSATRLVEWWFGLWCLRVVVGYAVPTASCGSGRGSKASGRHPQRNPDRAHAGTLPPFSQVQHGRPRDGQSAPFTHEGHEQCSVASCEQARGRTEGEGSNCLLRARLRPPPPSIDRSPEAPARAGWGGRYCQSGRVRHGHDQ
jgi:hypothetical protein